MGLLYGIDFGTTSSSLLIGRDDGSVIRVKDPGSVHASTVIPSSVFVPPSGQPVVGASAERAKYGASDRYSDEFKREFGDPSAQLLAGRSFRPDQLAVEVLRFLRRLATEQVPGDADVVVITVPAAWEKGNRDLMARAAGAAGFDPAIVHLEPEPAAAALYAASVSSLAGSRRSAGTTLVYDLGGGTFDCALTVPGATGRTEVLGVPDGLPDVGGSAFDWLILNRIKQQFPELAAKILDGPPASEDIARRRIELRDACEGLKAQLSVACQHDIYITDFDPPARFSMSRTELAELIRPQLAETIVVCERLLGSLGMRWADVDRIVPVGGSCRLPMVSETLVSRTGRPVLQVDAPEFAVAHGAVLYARALSSQRWSRNRHPERSPFED